MTDQNQPTDIPPAEEPGVASSPTGDESHDEVTAEVDSIAEDAGSEDSATENAAAEVAEEGETAEVEAVVDASAAEQSDADAGSEAGDVEANAVEAGDVEAGDVEAGASVEGGELAEADTAEEESVRQWYILKVASNRENSIRDGLARRVKIEGLDEYFGDIIVPVEEIAEFKNGKRRVTKRKLYPGYIIVHMEINDDTWFLVRETPGIGDFTGAAGKPTPMEPHEVQRILQKPDAEEEGAEKIKTVIPFNAGDHVRVKDGHFENFEGDVESIDETHGRVTVIINIFGRPTPVELEHWQVELV